MQPYNPTGQGSRKKLLLLVLPILILLLGSGAYAAINLSSQKPNQHQSLKPGINLDRGQKGLVGEWKLNGNTKDSTPYSDNGINHGTTPTTDRKGTANGAMNFDGTNNYISVPGNDALSPASSITISSWIRPTESGIASNYYYIVSKFSAGNHEYRCMYNPYSSNITFYDGDSNTINTASGSVPFDQWAHVVCEGDASGLKIYVNGQLLKSGGSAYAGQNTNATLTIGALNSGAGNRFQGSIADVRIYNRALSAADVTNLYNSYDSQVNLCSAGTASCAVNLNAGLIGSWPFDGNADDATPYQDNGTVTGATLTTNRFGAANTAYAFNGSGDYIAIPSGRFNLTNNFSLGVWIDPDSADAGLNYAIISSWRSTDGGQNWWFHRQRSGLSSHLSFQVNVGRSQVTSAQSLNFNTWYYVTLVLDSGVAKLYIDGNLAATQANFGAILSGNTGGLRIGGTNPSDNTAWFDGSIDDVRVYNRPLTPAEVEALYNLPD